jgi:hypothetical protein
MRHVGLMQAVAVLAATLGVLLAAGTVSAYTITGTVRYWDSRNQRSNNQGSLTTGGVGVNRPVGGLKVHLYELKGSCNDFISPCTEVDDDYLLGPQTTNPNGSYSFTLTGTHKIYIFSFYTDDDNYIRRPNERPLFVVSKPSITTSSSTQLDFNITCWDNAFNGTQGLCDNSASWVTQHFPENEAFANIYASMYLVKAGGFEAGTGSQAAYWPDAPTLDRCLGGGSGGAAFANGKFCVTSAFNNHNVGHEMGHIIHSRHLGINVWDLGGTCTATDDFIEADPSEKCATNEGFANFVGAAANWTRDANFPQYNGRRLEGNMNGGKCALSGSTSHRVRGNVARFFWDIYDSTNVGSDDVSMDDEYQSFANIAAVWHAFPDGTLNGYNREPGENGRNVEDYVARALITLPIYLTVERDHNCLGAQEN